MNPIEDLRPRFDADVADHRLTVLRDDGLYRHLRFRSPATGMYWFDLITWPGVLAINGDMGTYVFSRETDMFEFFRSGSRLIDDRYWLEKVQGDRSGLYRYDEKLARRVVAEHVEEYLTCLAPDELTADADEYDRSRFVEATAHRDTAAARIADAVEELDFDDEFALAACLAGFEAAGLTFADAWEWDLRTPDLHALWCLLAIARGIEMYDQSKRD